MSINLHVTMNIGLASYVATFILNLTLVCLLGYLLLLINKKCSKTRRPSLRKRIRLLSEVVSSLTLHLAKEDLTLIKPSGTSIDTVMKP